MATRTLKCPARITMLKENPPKFIVNKSEHIHATLKRGKYLTNQDHFTGKISFLDEDVLST